MDEFLHATLRDKTRALLEQEKNETYTQLQHIWQESMDAYRNILSEHNLTILLARQHMKEGTTIPQDVTDAERTKTRAYNDLFAFINKHIADTGLELSPNELEEAKADYERFT